MSSRIAWNRIPRIDLQLELKRLNELLNHAPSLNELREFGNFSEGPFYATFGSWTEALRSVNLTPAQIGTPLSDSELLQDLQRVAVIVGKRPTVQNYRDYGQFSPSRFNYHFGSFPIALEKIGYPITSAPDWLVKEMNQKDGAWLSGLADGEGSFIISRSNRSYGKQTYKLAFVFGFRDDDIRLLIEVKRIWQLSEKIHVYRSGTRRTAEIHLHDIETLAYKVAPTFEDFPLRSKKAEDFQIWNQAVMFKFQRFARGFRMKPSTAQECEFLERLYNKLHDSKQYNSNAHR